MLKKIALFSLFIVIGIGGCSNNNSPDNLPTLCIQEVKGVGVLKVDLLNGEVTSDGIDSKITGYHYSEEAYGFLWPFPISVPNKVQIIDPNRSSWKVGSVAFTTSNLPDGKTITSDFAKFGFNQLRVRSIVILGETGTVKNIIVQEEDKKTGKPVTIFENCGGKHLSLTQLKTVAKLRARTVAADNK